MLLSSLRPLLVEGSLHLKGTFHLSMPWCSMPMAWIRCLVRHHIDAETFASPAFDTIEFFRDPETNSVCYVNLADCFGDCSVVKATFHQRLQSRRPNMPYPGEHVPTEMRSVQDGLSRAEADPARCLIRHNPVLCISVKKDVIEDSGIFRVRMDFAMHID